MRKVMNNTSPNYGKDYYACEVGDRKGGCKFFAWKDGPQKQPWKFQGSPQKESEAGSNQEGFNNWKKRKLEEESGGAREFALKLLQQKLEEVDKKVDRHEDSLIAFNTPVIERLEQLLALQREEIAKIHDLQDQINALQKSLSKK
jgi:hypothetical protein